MAALVYRLPYVPSGEFRGPAKVLPFRRTAGWATRSETHQDATVAKRTAAPRAAVDESGACDG